MMSKNYPQRKEKTASKTRKNKKITPQENFLDEEEDDIEEAPKKKKNLLH